MRRYRIGRSDTNEIVIPDASVSRQHAEAVELGGGRFALSDLGSTFGTHVWQGQTWVPAKETEIGADTVIRFGEFRTTLLDVLSEAERAALGLTSAPPAPIPPEPVKAPPAPPPEPQAPPSAPPPAHAPPPRTVAPPVAPAPPVAAPTPPPAAEAPSAAPPPAAPPQATAPPATAPRPPMSERPPATRDVPRAAPRPRGPAPGGKRRALVLGLMAVGAFFAIAAGVIAIVLSFGDASGPGPRRDPPTAAGEGPKKFLEACTTNWGIEERRCRCFLAAAGPHLQPEDYDDFATLVEGHISGDSTLMESVMTQAGEKRGAPAGARLSAAMKGVTRDCPE